MGVSAQWFKNIALLIWHQYAVLSLHGQATALYNMNMSLRKHMCTTTNYNMPKKHPSIGFYLFSVWWGDVTKGIAGTILLTCTDKVNLHFLLFPQMAFRSRKNDLFVWLLVDMTSSNTCFWQQKLLTSLELDIGTLAMIRRGTKLLVPTETASR